MKTYRITPTVPIVGGEHRDLPVEEIRANTEKEAVDCFFETNPQYGERVHARCEEVISEPVPDYVPADLNTAELLVKGIIEQRVCDVVGIPADRFLRYWAAILYVHPGLHPDDYEPQRGGWPPELRLVACEAWRRYNGGDFSDEQFYCSIAAKARLDRNEPSDEPILTSGQLKAALPVVEMAVVEELKRLGFDAHYEHPGYVAVYPTKDKSDDCWAFGTANENWGGELLRNDGTVLDTVDLPISSKSTNVRAITTAIKDYLNT